MENSRENLEQFNRFLKEKYLKIQKQLEPYYKRVHEREENRMNFYGCATPEDKCLLAESVSIQTLGEKVDSCDSFEELVKKVKVSKENDAIFDLKIQLSYIDEYLKNRDFTIPDNTVADPQVSMEDKSNKMSR